MTKRVVVDLEDPIWWRLAETAERFGMSLPEYLAAVARRSLQRTKGPHFRVELDAEIRRLYALGLNNSEIAEAAGTNRELVRRRLKAWGMRTNGGNRGRLDVT